jgi:heme/copper-type cytochrome/quinol oxidase subunit 2
VKLPKLKSWMQVVTVAVIMAGVSSAEACATCFGKSDSKLAEGMNWGIFTLLLVVMSVLAGISAFFVFIARRAAQVGDRAPKTHS